MFYHHNAEGYRPLAPGIQTKTLVYGEKTLLTEFRLAQGAQLPRHAHPQEQTGYLVAGRLRLYIGEEAHDVAPGDSWSIPGGVEHRAVVVEEAVAIEVFSPLREDYLPAQPGGGEARD
jgi:quercetin dioxygenase-like cupin family protein